MTIRDTSRVGFFRQASGGFGRRAPYAGTAHASRVEPEEADPATARVLARLRALGSPVRLRILKALESPTRAADLRVPAGRERSGFESERHLGRTTVLEHLDVLREAGLVRRVGDAYVVDQQGMVAFLQDLSDLGRLRAVIEVDVESTRVATAPRAPLQPPEAPRLVLVGGPEAGHAFAVHGAGPWRIGRSSSCEVPLAHDPHVSRIHASLVRTDAGLVVRVEPGAKNGALIDFAMVDPGNEARVRNGSILVVGATTLVLQD